jgi:hypothetical protein
MRAPPGGAAVRLTLLTRAGCHLCEDMKAIVAEAARTRPLVLEEVDISVRPDLERRFGIEIPVLMCGELVVAQGRTTLTALVDQLQRSHAPVSRTAPRSAVAQPTWR